MTAVAITGIGIVSAAGTGVEATTRALRDGRSGLGRLTRFESPRCGELPVAEVTSIPDDGDPRTVSLARPAIAEAIAGRELGGRVVGLALGTCVGGMPETETALCEARGTPAADPRLWHRHGCAYTTAALCEEYGLDGPAITLSTACSSGAQAIAAAADTIRAGHADAMIAGGVDAICRLTLNGFASLLAVDPDGCRPFDRRRRGMSLGEGAAFVLLERLDDASASICALAGAGNSCDAHHATAPDPQGRGAVMAMRRALESAGIEPERVDYVNAHGTGTPDNDRAEGRAIRTVFGDRPPLVSSTKRVFGHTLGAAGAIEVVACAIAMRDGFAPGTPGLETLDPECSIEPVATATAAELDVVLSNSFGFGGNNTVLCLRRTA